MRTLFEIDLKDYITGGTVCIRPSVRALIRKDGLIAMIHSLKFDYYKFPGGGIETDEDHITALIREVREETGLEVDENTVREFGMVHRVQKGLVEDMFIQDNYYYLCRVKEGQGSQSLDDYEAEEGFTLEYVSPDQAINVNRTHSHNGLNINGLTMIDRDSRVLEMIRVSAAE